MESVSHIGLESARRHMNLAAIALAACASIGAFQTPASALTVPTGAGSTLTVAVSGHISPRCTVSADQSNGSSFGDILDQKTGRAAAETLDLPFSMSCNSPYVATLTSKNGALAHEGGSVPNFADRVDYSASLAMSRGSGGLSLACDSAEMRAANETVAGSRCRAVSNDGAEGDSRVKLRLHAGAQPLLKGVYSDELVLRLSPVVSG